MFPIFQPDISTNVSSDGESSLYFNGTTSIILDNSFQRTTSRPSSIAAILYKNINDIFPAIMNHERETRYKNDDAIVNTKCACAVGDAIYLNFALVFDWLITYRANKNRLLRLLKNNEICIDFLMHI